MGKGSQARSLGWPRRAWSLLSSSLLSTYGALYFAAGAPPGFPEDARTETEVFSWQKTYRGGLEAALLRRRPLLVYLPPTGEKEDPQVLTAASRRLGSPPVVEGARIGSQDVEFVLGRFEVKRLPAVLLLDRRENVLCRWEGDLPLNFWPVLRSIVRRQGEEEALRARQAEEAARLLEEGKLEPALRRAHELVISLRTPPEALLAARGVEEKVAIAGERALLAILAAEGLVPDSALREKLVALRAANPHPEVRAAVEREVSRLKQATIGARRG